MQSQPEKRARRDSWGYMCTIKVCPVKCFFFPTDQLRLTLKSPTATCENETSEQDVVTHSPEQVKGKRNALYAVVRDKHYRPESVSGENKHF